MIVRISGEGQYRLADVDLGRINELDAEVEAALDGGDFPAALARLLAAVREHGELLDDDELLGSDVILPAADATAEEVRAVLGEEGLLPG